MIVTVDRPHIESTYAAIEPYVRRTPLLHVDGDDVGLRGMRLALKLEALQVSGSFKARGAFSNLVSRPIPPAGVAAASGGNHGTAVAYAAMRRGVKAKIFVPSVASPTKIEKIRSYGADLTIVGERYADTVGACERYCAETGALNVHAFDQPETMLGTGTIGFEIEQQFSDVQTVLAGIGGGGLIGGIASWFATTPVRVIGVEPDGAPTMTRALEAGEPVDAPAGSIASDSLAPARIGRLNFPIAQRDVDRVLLVSDDEIRAAQRTLWNGCDVVAEPGGAAAFAAVLSGKYVPAAGERVCVVVSGGNTPAVSFS
ncbi:MAG: threonine/serine dehydratase [Vulcanimicrobiaceae bacterium]